jgi:hypothetical protein
MQDRHRSIKNVKEVVSNNKIAGSTNGEFSLKVFASNMQNNVLQYKRAWQQEPIVAIQLTPKNISVKSGNARLTT